MQFQPTAGGVPSSGTVRGLGVTDALQLELDAVQLPWLIDELDEVRGVYEEQLQHAADPRRARADTKDSEALERTQDQLRALRLMRAQLPAADLDRPVTFVGPTAVVLDIVVTGVGRGRAYSRTTGGGFAVDSERSHDKMR